MEERDCWIRIVPQQWAMHVKADGLPADISNKSVAPYLGRPDGKMATASSRTEIMRIADTEASNATVPVVSDSGDVFLILSSKVIWMQPVRVA